jgi:MoaA/NifB/PqqE/SkfB family radical SAM enzyme
MTTTAVPEQIQVMLTERCNLVCRHCAVPAEDSPADHELPAPAWRDAISTWAGAGLRDLVISGGEATLRRDAVSLAVHAHEQGISRTTLVSNGARMPATLIAELVSAQRRFPGFGLHVSLDGAGPETHDWMRGDGAFDRTLENLRSLGSAGGRVDGVHTVFHTGNVHELEEVAGLAARLGARTWTIFPIAAIGRGPDVAHRSLDRQGWQALLRSAPEVAARHSLRVALMGPVLGADWPVVEGEPVPRPSRRSADRLCVGPDGDAFACPPLRTRQLGSVPAMIAGGSAEVAAVTGRLRDLMAATCATCQFLLLCTAVDGKQPFESAAAGQVYGDPAPQAVTLGRRPTR